MEKKFNEQLTELMNKLKIYTLSYLDELGVKVINGKVQCLNPEHPDKNPSMSYWHAHNILHCFSCLPENQEVVTFEKGLVPIKDIKIGMHTIGLNGQKNLILNKILNDGSNKKMFKIQLEKIRKDDLSFTADHTHFVIKQKNIPFIRKEKNETVFYKKFYIQRPKKYLNKYKIEEVKTENLETGDFLFIPKRQISTNKLIKNNWSIFHKTSGLQSVNIENFEINEDIAWLFGLFLADGNTFRGGVNFSINNTTKKEYIEKIQNIIKNNFGYKCSVFYKNNSVKVICSSSDMQRMMDKLFGKHCNKKSMPEYFLHFPLNIQKQIYKGFYDGDGTKSCNIINTTSSFLLRQLMQININLEIHFSITKRNSYISKSDNKKRKESYILNTLENNSSSIFFDKVDGKDGCFIKIEKIEKEEKQQNVYDLTTEDGSFLTKYYLVHNCNTSMDIFSIANIKEGKPLYGKQFILDNVFYLAKKFNEPYQHINIEISPEEKAKFRKLEIMRLLSDYVTSKLNKNFLQQRKISVETALKLNIGSVISYDDLLQRYIANGFTEQEIKDLGIVKKRINENKLIFIIKNIHGQPVSFVSREMIFTLENAINYIGFNLKEYKELSSSQERQDYLYSKCNKDQNKINFVTNFLNTGKYENGTDSEIYSKRSIFYLYSDIKKEINSFEHVLIVEGYIDAVTAYQKGFRNIIALGSASFTTEHLNIIENSKEIRFPAITFDQDKTGIKRTQALVDRIKEHGNIRKKFFIAKYKEKGKDIDEILNNNVVKNFNEIFEYETLFQYSVSNLLENGLTENEIVEQMIPLIIQEPSPLKQSELAGELEKKLNTINKHTITAEIEYRLNNVKQQLSETVLKIVENTKKKIINNPESSTAFLQQAVEEIEASSIKGKKQKNIFALTEENIALDEEKKRDASRYNINFGLPVLKTMQITPGKTITVAAKPNIGKTSFFVNLAKDILTLNNNTVVYYYTTDDSRADIKNNLIAVLSGLPRQYVADPIHNKDYGLNSTNIHKLKMMAAYNESNTLVENWVKQKRLAILHSSDGVPDWVSFEKTLKYDLSQDKELENTVKILIIDSVNKIEVDGIINGNERAEYLSEHTKKSATKYDLIVFQNYEIRKADKSQKINLSMLAGTRRIEYDSDAIITLHQPLHELANLAHTKWKKPNLDFDLPVLIAEIEKTKIGGNKNESFFHKLDGFTNTLYYEFDFNTLSSLKQTWFEDLKMYKKLF